MSLNNPYPDPRLLEAGGLGSRPMFYEPFLPQAALRGPTRGFFDGYGPVMNGVTGIYRVDPKKFSITGPYFDPHNVFGELAGVREQATRYLATRGSKLVLP